MIRKLLIITLLLSAISPSFAQKKDKKKKKNKQTTEQTNKEINYKEIGSPLPQLKITTRKGVQLTNKDFEGESNLLVMMFNPTCDHCQEETILLEKHIEEFKKTKILLVAAPSMVGYLNFYNNVTRYGKYPKIVVGVDSAGYIDKSFIYEALPQINIYDKKRKLVKIFSGDTPIEALKPYID